MHQPADLEQATLGQSAMDAGATHVLHAPASAPVQVQGMVTGSATPSSVRAPVAIVPLSPPAARSGLSATTPIATDLVGSAARSSSPTSGTRVIPQPSPMAHSATPKGTMSGGLASPLRRSNRHPVSADGSSPTDEHALAKAMRRQASRNLDSTPGTSPVKSFLSFSDTRINNSLYNVGVSMGKNDNDINLSVGVLKHMEIDRLKVSSKCNTTIPDPETEDDDEADAKYDGPLISHLVGEVTEVGLDDARPGSMFCDFTASSRKSKSHASKKKQKPPKKAKSSTPIRVST